MSFSINSQGASLCSVTLFSMQATTCGPRYLVFVPVAQEMWPDIVAVAVNSQGVDMGPKKDARVWVSLSASSSPVQVNCP